jgi:hypothetical protein
MNTITQEWNRYKAACYPNGIPTVQENETRQAFMAGALSSHNLHTQVAEIESDDEAVRVMAGLRYDIINANAQEVRRVKGKN